MSEPSRQPLLESTFGPASPSPPAGEQPTLPSPDAGPANSMWKALPPPLDGVAADSSGSPVQTTPPLAYVDLSLPQVPGYDLLALLGRGGMGVVYKARHQKLQRLVALKMIRGGATAGPEELQRFRTEAEAIARLQHPHIVQIFEVGDYDSLPFLALEYCSGGSLDRELAGTPLPPQEAATLVAQLARSMHAAHAKGIVHRDLKPANVLLTEDGTPKITDFGLAKKLDVASQTQTGAVMGTPSYMAPEQASGQSATQGLACDIYALGAILYDCLTGRPPFKAATTLDTLLQVVHQEPVPPAQLNPRVPRDLETICLKCLRKEPKRRYASAAELADDLGRYLRGEPIAAHPATILEKAVKWAKRQPAQATTLAVSAVAALLLAAGGLWFTNELMKERNQAQQKEKEVGLARDAEKRRASELDSALKQVTQEQGKTNAALMQAEDQKKAAAAADLRHKEVAQKLVTFLKRNPEIIRLSSKDIEKRFLEAEPGLSLQDYRDTFTPAMFGD
jgi:tRNA A-37 threonylcarbamoyl transferase component Bud32